MAENVFAAGESDHFGDPVTGDERRVEPFEAEDAGARGRIRDGGADGGDAGFNFSGECSGFGGAAGGVAYGADVLPDVGEGVGSEGEDAGLDGHFGEGRGEVAGRSGADVAEVLGEDEVGLDASEFVVVDEINAFAAAGEFADLAVNFSGGERDVHAGVDEDFFGARRGGIVAFVGDAEDLVFEAEGEEDFGSGGKKRTDTHEAEDSCQR